MSTSNPEVEGAPRREPTRIESSGFEGSAGRGVTGGASSLWIERPCAAYANKFVVGGDGARALPFS